MKFILMILLLVSLLYLGLACSTKKTLGTGPYVVPQKWQDYVYVAQAKALRDCLDSLPGEIQNEREEFVDSINKKRYNLVKSALPNENDKRTLQERGFIDCFLLISKHDANKFLCEGKFLKANEPDLVEKYALLEYNKCVKTKNEGTFSAKLLTHQKITERLKSIHKDFMEKQYKSFEDNRNNELAIFQHRNNFSAFKCMKKSLKAYLSATSNAELYVVAVALPKATEDVYIEELLISAAEIIKQCKKNGSPVTLVRFDYKWECWKISEKSDYAKLSEAYKTATLVYIDECLPGYNSYDDYVKFYADFKYLESITKPITIISLQNNKYKETQFLDIEKICKSLSAFNLITTVIKLIKIRNYTPGSYTGHRPKKEIIFADVVDVDVGRFSKFSVIREIKWIDWANCFKFGKNIIYCESTEKMPPEAESKIKIEYPGLEYNKIIRQESLKLIRKDKTSLELVFTPFLIVNQDEIYMDYLDKESYKYEVLVMVKIKAYKYTFHSHAIRYPVKDVHGNDPIKDFDQNSTYYQKMTKCHSQMCAMLDELGEIIKNGCKCALEQDMKLKNILKLRTFWSSTYTPWMQSVKFELDIDSYHAKNNEFIANLQNKFGTNVNFKLFDIDPYYKSDRIVSKNNNKPIFPSRYFIINKEIGIAEYKNYTADRFSDVMIYITVKEKDGYEAFYLFFQEKNYKHAIVFEDQLKVKVKAENYLKNIVENLKEEDLTCYKPEIADSDAVLVLGLLEDRLQVAGSALLEYIKLDYLEFFLFHNSFCQKAIFFAIETVKTKQTGIASISVHKASTDERLDGRKGCEVAKDTKQETLYTKFIKEEILNIVDFESFTEAMLDPKNAYMNAELYSLYMAVLKHLHKKFMVGFVTNYSGGTRIRQTDERSAHLYQSVITENEETYKEMHNVLLETFEKSEKT